MNSHCFSIGRLGRYLTLLGLLFAADPLFIPPVAEADSVGGSARFAFSNLDSSRREATGEREKTESRFFLQHYSLRLDKAIFPNLKLRAGGLFRNEEPTFRSNDTKTRSENTRWSPFADLTWSDLVYTAGLGYDRREDRDATAGSIPPTTTIRENRKALFSWKPDEFPSLEARYLKTDTYDQHRETLDAVQDVVSAASRYQPIDGMNLLYRFSSDDRTNAVNDLEVNDRIHHGRVTYANDFLGGRFLSSASYGITRDDTELFSRGQSEIPLQEFPVFGLSSLDETPTEGALNQNRALIDDDMIASAGLDLGRGRSLQGDRTPRNMGLDFFSDTTVNTLYVWVDRELRGEVASSFSWDVYTSSDNLTWTRVETVPFAPFDAFENRFVIRFSAVTARFIKVTTRPLSFAVPVPPGTDVENIFVTELQAFLTQQAPGGRLERTRTSQVGNLNGRMRIIDKPLVFYDLSYWFVDPGVRGGTRDVLTNGVLARHVLSPVFTVDGRAAVENGRDRRGRRFAFVHNASLDAVPVPTLRHSLVYSGRSEESDAEDSRSDYSFLLKNYAQLYRGINVDVSGGVGFPRTKRGSQTSTLLAAHADFIPNSALNVDLGYSDQTVRGSDTGLPSSSIRIASASAGFRPFQTLYLVAAIDRFQEESRTTRTTPSYGATWSPFRDGRIQFTFTHSEEFIPEEDREERLTGPSIRWNVFRRTFLGFSYRNIRSKTHLESQTLDAFDADLQMSF